MWLWNLLKSDKERYIALPRCPHCGRVLHMRMHKGIPVYLCPRDEELLHSMQQPAPASKALSIRETQVTGPINISDMRHGELMHYYRFTHPSPVDTREVRAIRLKNKARRQQ